MPALLPSSSEDFADALEGDDYDDYGSSGDYCSSSGGEGCGCAPRVRTQVHAHAHTHTPTLTHMRTPTRMYAHIHTRTHACGRPRTHAHTHALVHDARQLDGARWRWRGCGCGGRCRGGRRAVLRVPASPARRALCELRPPRVLRALRAARGRECPRGVPHLPHAAGLQLAARYTHLRVRRGSKHARKRTHAHAHIHIHAREVSLL